MTSDVAQSNRQQNISDSHAHSTAAPGGKGSRSQPQLSLARMLMAVAAKESYVRVELKTDQSIHGKLRVSSPNLEYVVSLARWLQLYSFFPFFYKFTSRRF